jgi:hypothetical protein
MEVDHLYADLPCAYCHQLIAGDVQATMQTALNADAGYHHFHVGDAFTLAPGGPAANGYLLVNPPGSAEIIHLVNFWTCPQCGGEPNWAEISLAQAGGQVTIVGIAAVELNRETLASIHYISDELSFFYERLVGVPLYIKNEPLAAEPQDTLQRRPLIVLRPDWKELLANKL